MIFKQCIFGDHLKYGDTFIEKIPERVVICMKCSHKYPDNIKYKGRHYRVTGAYNKGYYLDDLKTIVQADNLFEDQPDKHD